MTSDVIQLRPEVLEIVREIAARPDSVLLRVPRGSEMRTLREDRVLASPTNSALSVAERHLVAVHREEVAYVLRCAAWVKVTRPVAGRDVVLFRQTTTRTAPTPDGRQTAIDAARIIREHRADPVADQELRLLERVASNSDTAVPDAVVLCAAAQRLVPSFRGRYMAASSLLLEGRLESSLDLARDALRSAPDSGASGFSWTLIAELAAYRRDWVAVEVASRTAIQMYPVLLSPYLARTWGAIHRADFAAAQAHLESLQELVSSKPDALDELVSRLTSRSGRLRAQMDQDAQRCLARVVSSSGSFAMRIFHAFL